MDIKEWMTPQEKQFFDDLESEAENMLQGARAFRAIFDDYSGLADHRRRIKDIEHRGDEIVHHIYESLNRAFVTPLAKEDLSGLASKLDDVLDYINGAATRLAVYEIDKPTKAMIDFADLILRATEQLRAGMTAVRDHKARDVIRRSSATFSRRFTSIVQAMTASCAFGLRTAVIPARICSVALRMISANSIMDFVGRSISYTARRVAAPLM